VYLPFPIDYAKPPITQGNSSLCWADVPHGAHVIQLDSAFIVTVRYHHALEEFVRFEPLGNGAHAQVGTVSARLFTLAIVGELRFEAERAIAVLQAREVRKGPKMNYDTVLAGLLQSESNEA
jgi:hypothetical protein